MTRTRCYSTRPWTPWTRSARQAGPGRQSRWVLRVMRFEMVLLRELGYSPALESCAACDKAVEEARVDVQRGGGRGGVRGLPATAARSGGPCRQAPGGVLRALAAPVGIGNRAWDDAVRKEVRQVLGHYVTYLWGRRPRFVALSGELKTVMPNRLLPNIGARNAARTLGRIVRPHPGYRPASPPFA